MSEAATKPAERAGDDDQFGFAIGVLCAVVGGLLILLYLIASAAAQGGTGELGSGVVLGSWARWILAVGAFLFVLGLGLCSSKLAAFFSQQRGLVALNQLLIVLLGTALLGLVNYVFARHDLWRWDVTSDRVFTLSEEARGVARGMPIETRMWFVTAGEPAMRQSERDVVRSVLEGIDAESDRISVKVTRELDLMSPQEQLRLLEELENPTVRSADDVLGVTIKLGRTEEGGRWVTERTRLVRWDELWQDPMMMTGRPGPKTFVGEQKIVSTLRELIEPEKPRIYFLEGHDERRLGDFDERGGLSSLVRGLRERNWSVEPLVLAERPRRDVPEDARALIIPGPRLTLPESDVAAISTWVAQGGAAIVLADPAVDGRRDKYRYVKSGLEPWLEKDWGLHLQDKTLYVLQITGQQMDRVTGDWLPFFDTWFYGEGTHKAVKELAQVRAPVKLNAARPVKVAPIPGVEQKTILEIKAPSQQPEAVIAAPPPVRGLLREDDPGNEFGGPFVLGVACERVVEPGNPQSKRARLVVFGDADLATNGAVDFPGVRNLELFLGVVNWATGREHEIVGKATRPRSYRLTMQQGQLEFFMAVSLAGMPALAIALGVVAWMLRRGGAA